MTSSDEEKTGEDPVSSETNPDKDNIESIQIDQNRNARFSGTAIIFPGRNKTLPAKKLERIPVVETAPQHEKDRSFLSFFDEPEQESETDSDPLSPFCEEDDLSQTDEESGGSGGGQDEIEESPLSFDEFVQKESEETAQEDIDNLIRQNDADALFAFGEEYERQTETNPVTEEKINDVSINPTSILEAMLFVGNRENLPLPISKATSLMRNVTEEDILQSAAVLNQRYKKTGAPYQIRQTESGLFLELRPELESVRERFFSKVREVKLSQKAIDILALVAYRQPISSAEIQTIRPQSGGILNVLLKRGLLEQEKAAAENGEMTEYRTTPRLLKILGINSTKELPIVDELDYR